MNRLVSVLVGLHALGAMAESPYARWKQGPPTDDNFFPIAVWLQAPRNASKYREIGINTYVGLWSGPTAQQLDQLEKAQMNVICDQKLEFKDRRIIIGWMHGDEPDNAQSLGKGKGYGPPVATEKIVEDYRKMKQKDPTRPVLLNLGQGVAYDNYIGRGVRRGRMEDYPKYIEGSDIVSFDIYPVNHDKPEIKNRLWYVPRGVMRLREWSKDQKIVWNCIECTPIGSDQVNITPQQVKSQVWMSLIHGSRGIIYFVHQFKPRFVEAGLLANDEMKKGIAEINRQLTDLAPVINSGAVQDVASIHSSNEQAPLALTVRRHAGSVYLLTVSMRNIETKGTIVLKGIKSGRIEVIGENRVLELDEGRFADTFAGYEVHLYRILK